MIVIYKYSVVAKLYLLFLWEKLALFWVFPQKGSSRLFLQLFLIC